MAEPGSPEHQIRDAIWTYGGWFVLLSLTLGAGITLGYIFWGDAVHLRATNVELNQKVLNATSEAENQHHPLSDQQVADELLGQGVAIARRTVAKYRDELRILPARLRHS